MESRLERIEREITADISGGCEGLDFADQVWLVDMVKAQHEYIRTVRGLEITLKYDDSLLVKLMAAQKALKDVEDRK